MVVSSDAKVLLICLIELSFIVMSCLTHTVLPPAGAPVQYFPSHSHHSHHRHHDHHPSTAVPPVLNSITINPTAQPAQAPTPPHPSHPSPVDPPLQQPPVNPPRQLVAIQGVVYCKSCDTMGVDTLTGANPLPDARVVLKCRNTKYGSKTFGTTDSNGYFFLMAPKTVTSFGIHNCLISLASAPAEAKCKVMTDISGGKTGAVPEPADGQETSSSARLPFSLHTVGPFAFEPSKESCKNKP